MYPKDSNSLSKVEELAKESVESFSESYEGCPYKNTP
jgi:hypothetical protein